MHNAKLENLKSSIRILEEQQQKECGERGAESSSTHSEEEGERKLDSKSRERTDKTRYGGEALNLT